MQSMTTIALQVNNQEGAVPDQNIINAALGKSYIGPIAGL